MHLHRITRSVMAALFLVASAAAIGGMTQVALDRSNGATVHPTFDLSNPDKGPFPSDRFTVPDDQNLSRRRVNLPKPADCAANRSECEDVDVLNQLDGFSLKPRVTIPFDGNIDPATVQGSVFFLALGDTASSWTDNGPDSVPASAVDRENLRNRPGFGAVTEINQIVWDPATRVLAFKADRLLDEHTRYALVVTNGIRDSAGRPIAPSETFHEYAERLTRTEDRWYRKTLLAAEWSAQHSEAVKNKDIVALSSFTTHSVTYLRDKITSQLRTAPPPNPANFNIGPNGSRAIFTFDQIESISHNQQVSAGGPPLPGDAYNLVGARWVQGAVGRIAFGKFTAPDFMLHPGEYIPPIRTRTGMPKPRGSNVLYFTLILPSGPKPARGWPVVVFGHGGNGTGATTPLEIASIPSSHGLAIICINLVGHGRGPDSTLTIRMKDGSGKTLPFAGRGLDHDGNRTIATAEGHYATAPRLLSLYADAVTQIGADQLSLVRLIQTGIDADGDGQTDLDSNRIYSLGQSFGAITSIPFAAYTQAVRASFFLVPGATPVEQRRLSVNNRPAMGSLLAARIPSLINANGLSAIGGVRVDEPFFNENMHVWGTASLVNNVPGAMAIQRLFDRIEWRGQTSAPTVFAPTLRKSPPAGMVARPTAILIGRGDQSAALVDSASLVREGALEDRTVLYRHDLFFAANPTSTKNSHTVYRFQDTTATHPITVAIQELFSQFFASDGKVLPQTSPYLETPISSMLPNTLDFIP